MSLTREELERRRSFVTATDVAAIVGASPWANAADVFLSKTRGVIKPGNAAMEAGSLLEPSIIAWASTKLGTLYPGDWRVAENGINAATLDAETADKLVVEAKSTGITGPGSPHQWGEEGTDKIPRYYLLQVHAQLLVTGAAMAFVPALIGGRGFVMYQVHRSQMLCDRIAEISEQFWREHVLAGVMPDCVPHLETLKYLEREAGTSVDISDDLAAEYLAASEERKAADQREDEAKAALIASLGTAEIGRWSGGEFTYQLQTRKAHQVKESTFPVLRQKSPKGTESKAEVINQVDVALFACGYVLREESESGSRYYRHSHLPDVRVSDHRPNAATFAWMLRNEVDSIRVDRPLWKRELQSIGSRSMKELVTA